MGRHFLVRLLQDQDIGRLAAHLGVKHVDIPITPYKVWQILKDKGVVS